MIRHIQDFLESLKSEKNLSDSTINAYRTDLLQFTKTLDSNDVRSISRTDLENYCKGISGLSDATVLRKLAALRHFFKFLLADEVIDDDPSKYVSAPKTRWKLPKIVDSENIKKIFESIDLLPREDSRRTKLIFMLMYGCGLRVSELINLKPNALEGHFLRIYGKWRKERLVPIAESVINEMREYTTQNNCTYWLFPNNVDQTKHITRQRVFQIVKAVSQSTSEYGISPHMLRHAFATYILNNGANLLSVKTILGHSSIATTEVYTHVTDNKLKHLVETHHPLAKS